MTVLTIQEIDRLKVEAQLEVEDLFAEFYTELLGERAPIMAQMQQMEMAQAQGEMEAENEVLGMPFGEMEGA